MNRGSKLIVVSLASIWLGCGASGGDVSAAAYESFPGELAAVGAESSSAHSSDPNRDELPGGELRGVDELGHPRVFPLKHTDVQVEIVGNVARVEVTQKFHNPYDDKIEAVYVFPLPPRAAVDAMEIHVGERTIKGLIKKRGEARRIYEAARAAGHVAALLDQERPNVFTQSVTNILPGNAVDVTIRYFETLPYARGNYAFSFPMVVGPRFIPGAPAGRDERGGSPDTTDVPDASRITPPVLRPGERSGHDIALRVSLDAGSDIASVASPSHRVRVTRQGSGRARIELTNDDTVPNKDFVLHYRVEADSPRVILVPHRSVKTAEAGEDGYFLMIVQPEEGPSPDEIAPKEMIFVVDGSGSMSGFPMAKVKEAMRHALSNLNPNDTFQIIRFSNRAEAFAPSPLPATRENVQRGLAYVETLSGRGGTIMLEGVREALGYPEEEGRLRIVSFMTDGYIGNENQILAYLEKHLGGARLFPFGVGTSVNRYLLDKMAELGRGAVEYVLLKDDAREPVKRFYERVRSPHLTDLSIDWGGLEVIDVIPERLPDLFVGQPVVVHGRYPTPGASTVTLRGRLGGRPYQQKLEVALPERRDGGAALATLWARARIEELSTEQIREPRPEHVEEITRLALAHRLVSAYTSFVAVEETLVTGSDAPLLVEVPVEMPEGVSYEGVFGPGGRIPARAQASIVSAPAPQEAVGKTPRRPRALNEDAVMERKHLEPLGDTQELEPRSGSSHAPGCQIRAANTTYRSGERIEIWVTLTNRTAQSISVPASPSLGNGGLQFQILDAQWKRILPPQRGKGAKTESVRLSPGATVTFKVVLNGEHGYRLEAPGTYHIVLLGSPLGLPDSNTVSIRVVP